MIIINSILIFILIFIFLFMFEIILKKNNIYKNEYFEEVCGKQNDVCATNSKGVSSCCDNYKCILPDGDYQYKICVNRNRLFTNLPKIAGISTKPPHLFDIRLPRINFKNMFDFSICKK
jgi:hypothetical protein